MYIHNIYSICYKYIMTVCLPHSCQPRWIVLKLTELRLAEGEGNAPNISHATTAANLFRHATLGLSTRYCRPS